MYKHRYAHALKLPVQPKTDSLYNHLAIVCTVLLVTVVSRRITDGPTGVAVCWLT